MTSSIFTSPAQANYRWWKATKYTLIFLTLLMPSIGVSEETTRGVGAFINDEIKMFKDSVMRLCPPYTVEQMVNGYMGYPEWESGKSTDGIVFVNVKGDINFLNKPVRATMQFLLKGTNFSLNAFEMNGVPSDNNIATGMLQKMCENVKTIVEAEKQAEAAAELNSPNVESGNFDGESVPEIQQPSVQKAEEQQQNIENSQTYDPIPLTPLLEKMIAIASNNGGVDHISDLYALKRQIDELPKPAHGNKKAARKANKKGLAASKSSQFILANQYFIEAFNADPANAEIVNNLGFSYIKLGDINHASKFFVTALMLAPERTAAWNDLARVYAQQNQPQEAVACFALAFIFSKNQNKSREILQAVAQGAFNEHPNVRQAAQQALQLSLMQDTTNGSVEPDVTENNPYYKDWRSSFIKYQETMVIPAPNGFITKSNPSMSASTVKISNEYAYINMVGYVDADGQRFYMTEWSWNQYNKGKNPTWILIK